MRIFSAIAMSTIALVFTSVSAAEDLSIMPDHTIEELNNDELPLDLELSSSVVETDPIVTGGTISSDYLTNWEYQSSLYEECPECVANQPFPED